MKKLILLRLFLLLLLSCIGHLLADAQTDHAHPLHPFSYHNYWIVAQGVINDTLPANFCLDTAAEGLSLDSCFVRMYKVYRHLPATEALLGIIGNKILEKYDVVIDYVNLYLYLRPNAQHDTPVATETGITEEND